MSTYRNESDNAAARYFAGADLPAVTVSGRDAEWLRDALQKAEGALRSASDSRLRSISHPAREALVSVNSAWATIDRAINRAKERAA